MTHRPYDGFVQRQEKLKPCLVDACTALVLSAAGRKRCDVCQREYWQKKSELQRAGKVVRLREEQPFQESWAEIDRRFNEALAEIRRQPRPEPDAWGHSTLHGLSRRQS